MKIYTFFSPIKFAIDRKILYNSISKEDVILTLVMGRSILKKELCK